MTHLDSNSRTTALMSRPSAAALVRAASHRSSSIRMVRCRVLATGADETGEQALGCGFAEVGVLLGGGVVTAREGGTDKVLVSCDAAFDLCGFGGGEPGLDVAFGVRHALTVHTGVHTVKPQQQGVTT